MKVKLIQGGGFVGRSKFAEEDLANYSDSVRQYMQHIQTMGQNTSGNANLSHPDSFQYYLEFNNNRVQIDDNAIFPNEVQELINHLKSKLHY